MICLAEMDWVYLPFAFPVWTVCTTGESTKLDLSVDMMWTASPAVVCVRYRYFLLDGSVMEFRLASLFLCRVTLLHVDPSVHRMIEPNQTSLLPRYSRTTSNRDFSRPEYCSLYFTPTEFLSNSCVYPVFCKSRQKTQLAGREGDSPGMRQFLVVAMIGC